MPILSTFFGIVIRIFHGDHNPPHIHVGYGGDEAIIEIKSGKILEGKIPLRARKLTEEWRKIHIKELEKAWSDSTMHRMPTRIAPLK